MASDDYRVQGRRDAGFINVSRNADVLRSRAASSPNYSPRAHVDLQFLLIGAVAVALLAYYKVT